MMIKTLINTSILLVLFTSCSNEKVVLERDNYKVIFNSTKEKYTGFKYYPDGTIEAEEELNQEYKINGFAKSYYENGILQLQETFKDGIKQGEEIAYYPTGIIQYKGQNKSAVKDSVWYWFRNDSIRSEKLLAIENYSNGKLFGSQVRFDSLSNMPIVKFYSFDGLLGILKSKSSNSGNYTVDGELAYCMYNKNKLQVGDTFDLSVFLGHSVNNEVEVKLKLIDAHGKEKEINPSISKVHDYMSRADWTYKIKKNAKSSLLIEIGMSENNEVIYESSLKLPLIVD